MKLRLTKSRAAAAIPVAPALTSPGPPAARPPAPEPVKFVERLGDERVHWSVVEVDARGVPGARGARCLVFANSRSIRRVWDYPEDWRTLDDAALSALSWGR